MAEISFELRRATEHLRATTEAHWERRRMDPCDIVLSDEEPRPAKSYIGVMKLVHETECMRSMIPLENQLVYIFEGKVHGRRVTQPIPIKTISTGKHFFPLTMIEDEAEVLMLEHLYETLLWFIVPIEGAPDVIFAGYPRIWMDRSRKNLASEAHIPAGFPGATFWRGTPPDSARLKTLIQGEEPVV